jgi:hypothetical protein
VGSERLHGTGRSSTASARPLWSRSAVRASPLDSEFEGVSGGDEAVQAAIEEQLRLQLKSEVIKEGIKDDMRSKVEDIKQISEEVGAVVVACSSGGSSGVC